MKEYEGTEADAMEDWDDCDHSIRRDIRNMLSGGSKSKPEPDVDQINKSNADKANKRYSLAKSAKVGDTVCCPGCGKKFIKTTHNKTFCSNGRTVRGKSSCKDRFWNLTTPSKLEFYYENLTK